MSADNYDSITDRHKLIAILFLKQKIIDPKVDDWDQQFDSSRSVADLRAAIRTLDRRSSAARALNIQGIIDARPGLSRSRLIQDAISSGILLEVADLKNQIKEKYAKLSAQQQEVIRSIIREDPTSAGYLEALNHINRYLSYRRDDLAIEEAFGYSQQEADEGVLDEFSESPPSHHYSSGYGVGMR